MKTTKILYVIAWLVPAITAALYIAGYIPQAQHLTHATMLYLLSFTTVAVTLLTAFLAMRLFSFSIIKKRFGMLNEAQGIAFYQLLCRMRIIFVLMVVIIDLATYYIIGSSSPLYLAAIMLVALVFCWPNNDEQSGLSRHGKE